MLSNVSSLSLFVQRSMVMIIFISLIVEDKSHCALAWSSSSPFALKSKTLCGNRPQAMSTPPPLPPIAPGARKRSEGSLLSLKNDMSIEHTPYIQQWKASTKSNQYLSSSDLQTLYNKQQSLVEPFSFQDLAISMLLPIPTALYYMVRKTGTLVFRLRNTFDDKHERHVSWWSDHPAFRRLSAWAFETCAQSVEPLNPNNDMKCALTGELVKIDRTQVYTGILLVHLHLAQYFGIAACNPPTRERINQLILQATSDSNSDYVNRREFTDILIMSVAHVTSRILVYYSMLLVVGLIPLLLKYTLPIVLRHFCHHHQAPKAWVQAVMGVSIYLAERLFSLALFVGFVPILYNNIDKSSHKLLKPKFNSNHGMQI